MLLVHRISKATPGGPALDSMARPLLMRRGGGRKMARRQAFHSQNEGCQEPALRSGREAPSSSGRRRRRAARRTRRSVSIAPPKAGRGTECARRELSISAEDFG